MNGREPPDPHVTVADAVAELGALRCSDPAARHAVHVIRLTRLTLEAFWLGGRRNDADGG